MEYLRQIRKTFKDLEEEELLRRNDELYKDLIYFKSKLKSRLYFNKGLKEDLLKKYPINPEKLLATTLVISKIEGKILNIDQILHELF